MRFRHGLIAAVFILAVPLFAYATPTYGASPSSEFRSNASARTPTSRPSTPSHVTGIRNRAFSGPTTGAGFFTFGVNGCSFVYQQFDGSYAADSGGTGTWHIHGCANTASVPGGFEFTGVFTVTSPAGVTLSGTAEGTVFPLHLTLTVTSSSVTTGHFRNIAGSIDYTANNISGPQTGALTASLQRATAH